MLKERFTPSRIKLTNLEKIQLKAQILFQIAIPLQASERSSPSSRTDSVGSHTLSPFSQIN